MFYVGLDLGQRVDHSAIAVVERPLPRLHQTAMPAFSDWRSRQEAGQPLLVRHLERVPLGTPYPRVVARVREIVKGHELAGGCSVAVDATGVGAPVVEMLRSAGLGCELHAITITGGERATCHSGMRGTEWSVPKQDLLSGVQLLLEQGVLRIARDLREAGSLVKELLDVRTTVRTTAGSRGQMRVGADGHGEHDDLVIALALACWSAGRSRNVIGHRRIV